MLLHWDHKKGYHLPVYSHLYLNTKCLQIDKTVRTVQKLKCIIWLVFLTFFFLINMEIRMLGGLNEIMNIKVSTVPGKLYGKSSIKVSCCKG